MLNIKSIINSHSRKILHSPVNNQIRRCNCINKRDYPLQEKYLTKNTLYRTDISSENFQTKICYRKQNSKTNIRTIKNPSTTKSTKMTRNYEMNSGKLKLQKNSQS